MVHQFRKGVKTIDADNNAIKAVNGTPSNKNYDAIKRGILKSCNKPDNNTINDNYHTIKRGTFNNHNKPDTKHVANHFVQPTDINVKSKHSSSGPESCCQANSVYELKRKKDVAEFSSATMWNPVCLKLGHKPSILVFRYLARSDFEINQKTPTKTIRDLSGSHASRSKKKSLYSI